MPSMLQLRAIALNECVNRLDELLQKMGPDPLPGSKAAIELQTAPSRESVVTVVSQGGIAVGIVMDQSASTARLLSDERTSGPWVTARAGLEAVAIVEWLLDPSLTPSERMARSLGLRAEELRRQLEFATRNHGDAAVPKIRFRLEQLAAKAKERGYPTQRTRKQDVHWVGVQLPTASALAKSIDESVLYGILSALAHGDAWAHLQLAREVSDEGENRTLGHRLSPEGAAWLIAKVNSHLGRAVWRQAQYMGHPQPPIKSILDECAAELEVPRTWRLWDAG